jgi:hypothetical protein
LGEFGEVNISALLNSFQMGYDKRVRPNYGGTVTLKQGCQIFLGTAYQNGRKYTKLTTNIPNGLAICPKAVK